MTEEEEYPISVEDLKKKFQTWFGNPAPADPPFPAEVEPSIGNPALAGPPLPVAPIQLDLNTPGGQADNSKKFSETLNLGFSGAVSLGAVVAIILFFLNLSFPGWYSDYWPSQFIIIFLAVLLGFNIGLSKGYVAQQREKYLYNADLSGRLIEENPFE